MNKLYTTLLCILVFLCGFSTVAAKDRALYAGEIHYKDIRIVKQEDKLVIRFSVDISDLELSKQLLLCHTPVLQSADLSKEYVFDQVWVAGTVRNKVIQRQKELYLPEGQETLLYVVHKNRQQTIYPLTLTLPFEEWMREARLTCKEQVEGCANFNRKGNDILIADRMLPALYVPCFELQYVMPEVEQIKYRSETYTARVSFKVGKYDLIREFENNASILWQTDQIVTEIRNDQNLTVQGMAVTGYASPEGDYNSNLELSKNRTYSFVDYLVGTHSIERSMIKVNWLGEDWQGLAESIEKSSLPEREAVLTVIEENDNVSRRKDALKKLHGGVTYKNLLDNFYPPLRRIEYNFSYVARPFDVQEAREVVKTNPRHLSLHEMFLVANTYEKGSEEFDRLFDIAVRLFPDDPVANLNAAVQEIEMGVYDKAIERLEQVNTPEAWNNLGIAYIRKGDFTQGKIYLHKAIEHGNATAKKNMQELELFLQND